MLKDYKDLAEKHEYLSGQSFALNEKIDRLKEQLQCSHPIVLARISSCKKYFKGRNGKYGKRILRKFKIGD